MRHLVDGSLQLVADLEDAICARCSIPAGGLEAAWVNDQLARNLVADGTVGVAVDHAVGLGKQIPERGFNVVAQTGTVGEADGEFSELKAELGRQRAAGNAGTHVAVHRVHGFIMKGIQKGNVRQVTGMDDGIATGKTVLYNLFEILIKSHQVGV